MREAVIHLFKDGGHRVSGDDSIRLPARSCSSCAGSGCRTTTACHVPESAPAPRRRIRINPFACFGAVAGLAALAACVQALHLF